MKIRNFVICLAVLSLVACATNPNAQRVQMATALDAASQQADRLQRLDLIDNDDEDRIQDKIVIALRMLKSNSELDQLLCLGEQDRLTCVGNLLDQIERDLIEAQNNGD